MASPLTTWAPALAVIILVAFFSRRSRRYRLPPGPKGIPVLGNLLDMPSGFEWLTFEKWSKQYGCGLIYLNVAGTPLYIVNSAEHAIELFEKRSAIYSSRGRFVMVCELMDWDFDFGFMPYGNTWREHRRMFTQQYSAQAIVKYHHRITRATHTALARILEHPDDYMIHFRAMAASTIMSVTYGITPSFKDDPYVAVAEDALDGLVRAANPGSYLVDFIPALKYVPEWFPGAGFKRQAARWRRSTREMIERPFNTTKRNMVDGKADISVVSILLSGANDEKNKEDREITIRSLTGAAYSAGTDSTSSILSHFTLVMMLNPETRLKAQRELDAVVGSDRLPTLEDRSNLPYIAAVLREVLRWRPVAPLGIPHNLSQDDEYRGYFLPKGATIIANIWAILHDELLYPNPETFNPDRFLTKEGALDPNVPNPEKFVFGFGRRVCPGRFLGLTSVWLAMSNLLATFDFEMPKDDQGQEIRPSEECTSGLAMYPVPFRCIFKPRSANAEALIRAAENETGA